MSLINFHTKEISVKIVFYGPGLCGKTTSLQKIYASLPEESRPDIVALATEVDHTLYFDFLPVTAYRIADFDVRLQLYTVPGQVFYNATRKLVLDGVDGIVFVADSQTNMRDSNLESLHNLHDNLAELGLDLKRVPVVMQLNKRDLVDIDSIDEMNQAYNPSHVPVFGTVATTGVGVFDALNAISRLVINDLMRNGLEERLEHGRRGALDTAAEREFAQTDAVSAAGPSLATATQAVLGRDDTAGAHRAAGVPMAKTAAGRALWPGGDYAALGARLDVAVQVQQWSEVLLGADTLVRYAAMQWATSAAPPPGTDVMTPFLGARGVSEARVDDFIAAVRVVRAGGPVDRRRAMNAFVLALEAVW